MAITWKPKITPINLSTKEASITVTRTETDDTDPVNPIVVSEVTYTEPNVVIDTDVLSNNLPIADELWGKHQAKLAKDVVIAAFVNELETLLQTNLEARE